MSEIDTVPESIEVCIVGAGSAALSAAIAAKEVGAEVLLVEKSPKEMVGGDLRYCGIIKGVTPDYSEEKFYADTMRLSGNRANTELVRIMVGKSKDMINWLTNLGVKWLPRTPVLYRPEGSCYKMLLQVLSTADKMGIKIIYNTKVTDLLMDDFGRIVGVRVKKKNDRFRNIKCGATILACGGFSANPEMMCKYIDRYADTMIVRGSKYNTGEGIIMAKKAGAKLAFMGEFHGGPEHRDAPPTDGGGCTVQPYSMGLWINLNGKRFLDEGKETYVKVGKSIFTQPGNIAFLIFDDVIKNGTFKDIYGIIGDVIAGRLRSISIDTSLPEDDIKRCKVKKALGEVYYKADTVQELAKIIGMSEETLGQTIYEYNSDIQETGGLVDTPCAPHIDPPKSGWAYPISHPPYYAYPTVCGITLTFGGIVINAKGEVLTNEENVIPGLYAVGALTSGFFYYDYDGGSALTRNIVFGRITGENALHYIRRD